MRSCFAIVPSLLSLACGPAEPVRATETEVTGPGEPTPTLTEPMPVGPGGAGPTGALPSTPMGAPGAGGTGAATPPPATGMPTLTPTGPGSAPLDPTPDVPSGAGPSGTIPAPSQPVGGAGGTAPVASGGAGVPSAGGGASGQNAAGTGAGGGPVSPGGVACTGSELLCEDFESVADGAVPGAPWLPLDSSCEFQTAQFTMGVSTEQVNPASGSTRALKITNKHFAQCRLSGKFDAVDEFWVRAFAYWGAELDISNRETLDIDLTPGFRTADDPAVRFGYRSKAPCEEYAGPQVTIIGLVGGEYTGCGSRPMPQGQWFCFEAHVNQATVLDVRTYVDGEAMSYQSTGKPLTESVSTESAIAEKLDHIRLGIFSTGEAQGTIYLDDVAVATSRLGCGG